MMMITIIVITFHQILTLWNGLCKAPGQELVSTPQMVVSCLQKTLLPQGPQRDWGVPGHLIL